MVRFNWGAALCFVPALATSVIGSVIPEHGEFNTLSRRAMPQFDGFEKKPEKKERIVQSIKDMKTMVSKVLDALDGSDSDTKKLVNNVLTQYFPEEWQEAALSIIKSLVEPAHIDASTGSDILQMVQFNEKDVGNGCMPSDDKGIFSNQIAWGYTMPGTSPSQIHFCDSQRRNAFKYPDLNAITCQDIGSRVSWKMLPLAYVLIHELTHAIDISGPVLSQACFNPIYTKDPAYGPQLTRELCKDPDNPQYASLFKGMQTVQNADSYAWFVTEAYWSLTCGRAFGSPTDNRNFYEGVCMDGNWQKVKCLAPWNMS